MCCASSLAPIINLGPGFHCRLFWVAPFLSRLFLLPGMGRLAVESTFGRELSDDSCACSDVWRTGDFSNLAADALELINDPGREMLI